MGYRSEVAIALSKTGTETLHAKLSSPDVSEELRCSVTNLLGYAEQHYIDQTTGAEMWYWDWIKWYGGNFAYYENIKFIEDTLAALEDDEYRFIRIGEEYEDVELSGTFWDNPFELELVRGINISEPA